MKEKDTGISKSGPSSASQRETQELGVLYEITRHMSTPAPLEDRMRKVLDVLHEKMGMHRGTLTLLDPDRENLTIEIAHGLDDQAKKKGRYKVGEGITGRVVAAGEPIAVPNIGEEPLFLNRTGARRRLQKQDIAFICVPIKLGNETIGALSADCLSSDAVSCDEDVRLLSIIASMIAQAVRLRRAALEERQRLLEENQRLFGITIGDLLTENGRLRKPASVYRKVVPASVAALVEQNTDDAEAGLEEVAAK